MEKKTPPASLKEKGGLIAAGSVLSGFAAFLGASCCVLPLILVNLGLSTAIVGKLVFFARFQHYFLWAAAFLIAAGFAAAFWKGRRPRGRVLFLLIVAAGLTAGAFLFPHYEGQILTWLTAS